MRFFLQCGRVLMIWMVAGSAMSAPFFSDSFETGDLQATGGGTFKWSSGGAVVPVMPNDKRAVVDGAHSLLFPFPAGANSRERRFSIAEPRPDLWLRFWVRVPVNYEHDWPKANSNRKFFAIWMDGYSQKGDGPTVVWEFWKDHAKGSMLSFHWSKGGFTGTNQHIQHAPFISYPSDQGRWMQVVIHVKAASSKLSSDGVIQLWRRWHNEEKFALLHETSVADIPIPAGGPKGWKNGYLMGWVNAPYDVQTDWYIDDFAVATESLLQSSSKVESPPAPPVLEVISD